MFVMCDKTLKHFFQINRKNINYQSINMLIKIQLVKSQSIIYVYFGYERFDVFDQWKKRQGKGWGRSIFRCREVLDHIRDFQGSYYIETLLDSATLSRDPSEVSFRLSMGVFVGFIPPKYGRVCLAVASDSNQR